MKIQHPHDVGVTSNTETLEVSKFGVDKLECMLCRKGQCVGREALHLSFQCP